VLPRQREDVSLLTRRKPVEWPTIALAALIYGGWGLLTFNHASLPFWALLCGGAWFTAWQSSLQHEIIHGHPTRSRGFNRLLACWPLLLWLPYESYRRSHLIHHADERLTDPLDDPESHYWTPEQWAEIGVFRRAIIRANATLLGRILIGPAWSMVRFVGREMAAIMEGDEKRRRIWATHTMLAGLVLAWVVLVCGMSPIVYFVTFVYPGTALMLVRSFAEHRAESDVDERTAIVENAPVLGLLYLYNNLHVVHHDRPTLPWYEIPGWYRANRDRLIEENGGLVYRGYLDVARRYLLTVHDDPVHPYGRAPSRKTA
jgi:fatty acid desaturase